MQFLEEKYDSCKDLNFVKHFNLLNFKIKVFDLYLFTETKLIRLFFGQRSYENIANEIRNKKQLNWYQNLKTIQNGIISIIRILHNNKMLNIVSLIVLLNHVKIIFQSKKITIMTIHGYCFFKLVHNINKTTILIVLSFFEIASKMLNKTLFKLPHTEKEKVKQQ